MNDEGSKDYINDGDSFWWARAVIGSSIVGFCLYQILIGILS